MAQRLCTLLAILEVTKVFSLNSTCKEPVHPINTLPDLNDQPVFGILTQPLAFTMDKALPHLNNMTQYIGTSYVKYIEMSGARVVPISLNRTHEEIYWLLRKLNGVFFTGGDYPFWVNSSMSPVLTPEYAEIGCYIIEQVKKINDEGIFFPLWGTCLGFELIHVCAHNDFETIGDFHGEPAYTTTNKFTDYAKSSAIFTYRSDGMEILEIFENRNVSLLGHRFGVSPLSYERFDNLKNEFEIVSIMHDRSGSPFLAMIEGKKYPIFGCQFHPEKNMFEFTKTVYPHDESASRSSTYLSNFIVSLGRKNNNTFPEAELSELIIHNWPPVFTNYLYTTINLIID